MSSAIPEYKFKEPVSTSGFEIARMEDLVKKSRKMLYKPHRQDFYGIFYFTRSGGVHVVDFERYPIGEGDVFIITPGQAHYFRNLDEVWGEVVLFTPYFLRHYTLLEEISASVVLRTVVRLGGGVRSRTEKLLELLRVYYLSGIRNKEDILKNLLEALLTELFFHWVDTEKTAHIYHKRLIRFRRLLTAHHTVNKEVAYYAGKLHISPKTLNQSVRKATGKSAKQYISGFVLLQAKRELVHTRKSIKEIAYGLGFDEPTNFTKFFKKYEGETPLQFRKKHG